MCLLERGYPDFVVYTERIGGLCGEMEETPKILILALTIRSKNSKINNL